MQIKVIVETQEEYDAWMNEQDTFKTLVSAQ
jgi:heme/copper-type cytochrome/quinol oxidase subunit 2